MREWYAPQAAAELLAFRTLVSDYEREDVLSVVLARAARSARRTTHFDLDFPRTPQLDEYWCHKHRHTCRPVATARQFVRRYTLDTIARIKDFAHVRGKGEAAVLHGDARTLALEGRFDGVIEGIVAALRSAAEAIVPGSPVVIVVDDRRDLYPAILERAGLALERRLRRHVNRRTGRRAGEFFEDILVARTAGHAGGANRRASK